MKKGITLTALSIYLVLFFTFTAFVLAITTRYNEDLFLTRGLAINTSSMNKLQYNLNVSKEKSASVSKISDYIVFDNGDSYSYDANKKQVLLNNGILLNNVEACTFETANINGGTHLKITITLKKYLSENTKTIELFMEG